MSGSRDTPEGKLSGMFGYMRIHPTVENILPIFQARLKLTINELQDHVEYIHTLAIATIGAERFHRKPQEYEVARLESLYKEIQGDIKTYLHNLFLEGGFTNTDNFKFREGLAALYEDISKKVRDYKCFLFEYVLGNMVEKIQNNEEEDAFQIIYPFLNIAKNGLDKKIPAAERRFAVSLMRILIKRGHLPLIELLIEHYNYKVTAPLTDFTKLTYNFRDSITTTRRNFFDYFMVVYMDLKVEHFTDSRLIQTPLLEDVARPLLDDWNKLAIFMHHVYIRERLSDSSEKNNEYAIKALKSLYDIIPTLSLGLTKSDFFKENISDITRLFLQSDLATLKAALPYLPLSNDELLVEVTKSKDIVHEVIFVEALLARNSFDVTKVFSPIIYDQHAIRSMVHEKIEEIVHHCTERKAGSENQVVELKEAINKLFERSKISISEIVKRMLSEIIATRNKIREHFTSNPHGFGPFAIKGSPTASALETLLKDLIKNLPFKYDEQKVAAACDPGNKELTLEAIVPPENWSILLKIEARLEELRLIEERLEELRLSKEKARTSTAPTIPESTSTAPAVPESTSTAPTILEEPKHIASKPKKQ